MAKVITKAKFIKPVPIPGKLGMHTRLEEDSGIEAYLDNGVVVLRAEGIEVSFPATNLDFAWTEDAVTGPRSCAEDTSRTGAEKAKGRGNRPRKNYVSAPKSLRKRSK